jgi:hypothetical protein
MKCWQNLPDHYKKIELDEVVIMPNGLSGSMVILQERV